MHLIKIKIILTVRFFVRKVITEIHRNEPV